MYQARLCNFRDVVLTVATIFFWAENVVAIVGSYVVVSVLKMLLKWLKQGLACVCGEVVQFSVLCFFLFVLQCLSLTLSAGCFWYADVQGASSLMGLEEVWCS